MAPGISKVSISRSTFLLGDESSSSVIFLIVEIDSEAKFRLEIIVLIVKILLPVLLTAGCTDLYEPAPSALYRVYCLRVLVVDPGVGVAETVSLGA